MSLWLSLLLQVVQSVPVYPLVEFLHKLLVSVLLLPPPLPKLVVDTVAVVAAGEKVQSNTELEVAELLELLLLLFVAATAAVRIVVVVAAAAAVVAELTVR